MIVWDENKRRANIAKHGLDLAAAAEFDFNTAVFEEDMDVRHERRVRAIGFIGGQLFFLVFADSGDDESGDMRVISLRRATAKEKRRYVETSEADERGA
jgi:hypothetical protein